MSVFENFPYTNFHNLNLDWVLNKLKSFEERLTNIEINGGGSGGGTGGSTGGGSSIDVTALEAKIAAKQDKLTFDPTPTQNSTNPVTSGGVYSAIVQSTNSNNQIQFTNVEYDGNMGGYVLTANSYVTITDQPLIRILPGDPTPQTVPIISFRIDTGAGACPRAVVVGPRDCYHILKYGGRLSADWHSYDDGDLNDLNFNISLDDQGIKLMLVSNGSGQLRVDRLAVEIMYYPIWD